MEPRLAAEGLPLPGCDCLRIPIAGDVTIALALEGQLRLDDQPALHEAVALARRHRGGRLIVLACRPEAQRLRGLHQRRLEAQALACLIDRRTAVCSSWRHGIAVRHSHTLGINLIK